MNVSEAIKIVKMSSAAITLCDNKKLVSAAIHLGLAVKNIQPLKEK